MRLIVCFNAPCTKTESGGMFNRCIIRKVGVRLVLDSTNQTIIDICNVNVAILSRVNLNRRTVLTRITDNLINKRWQSVNCLNRTPLSLTLFSNSIRPLFTCREFLIVQHFASIFAYRLLVSLDKLFNFFKFHGLTSLINLFYSCFSYLHYIDMRPK